MVNTLELSFHLVSGCFYTYITLYGIPYLPGYMDTYLTQHKFLTIQCLYFQTLYYVCATVSDIKELMSMTSRSDRKQKSTVNLCSLDYLFTSIVFPITITVSVMFWAVFFVDHASVCPPEDLVCMLDHEFSNHALHTAPIFTSLLEVLLARHNPTRSFLKGIMGWIIYVTAYISLVYWIAYKKHFWVYPFLGKLSSLHRALFLFGGFWAFGALAYVIGVQLIRCLNDGGEIRDKKKH